MKLLSYIVFMQKLSNICSFIVYKTVKKTWQKHIYTVHIQFRMTLRLIIIKTFKLKKIVCVVCSV